MRCKVAVIESDLHLLESEPLYDGEGLPSLEAQYFSSAINRLAFYLET